MNEHDHEMKPLPSDDRLDQEEKGRGIWDHLIELKRRLIWFLSAFLLFTLCGYLFAEPIYGWLVHPLAEQLAGESRRLIYTGLAEAFLTYLKLAFYVGFFAALPVGLYQIWAFMHPGLYPHERRAITPFFVVAPFLFVCGGAVAYFGVIPAAWSFFSSFERPIDTASEIALPIVLEARVGEYLTLTLTLIMAFGFAFQLPVVLGILARLEVISAGQLRRWRKYAFMICLLCAAFLTPPDIISQVALAVPMYLLYEISLLTAWASENKRARQEKDSTKSHPDKKEQNQDA